jgi:hypothetical protein
MAGTLFAAKIIYVSALWLQAAYFNKAFYVLKKRGYSVIATD